MAAQKWEGTCSGEVTGVPAAHVWALLADFCNVQKLMPNIQKCVKVEENDGVPGLVRLIYHHVSSDEPQVLSEEFLEKENGTVWAKERLLVVDEKERYLKYDLMDSNIGVKNYEAAFKVEEIDGGGCRIVWSYAADPIDGMSVEDMKAQRSFLMETMIQKILSDYKA